MMPAIPNPIMMSLFQDDVYAVMMFITLITFTMVDDDEEEVVVVYSSAIRWDLNNNIHQIQGINTYDRKILTKMGKF